MLISVYVAKTVPKAQCSVHAMQKQGHDEAGTSLEAREQVCRALALMCRVNNKMDRGKLVTVSSHPLCTKYNTPFYPYTCSTTPPHWLLPGGYPPWQSLVRFATRDQQTHSIGQSDPYYICHLHDAKPSTNAAVTRLYVFAGYRRHWAGQAAMSAHSAFCSTSLSNPPLIGCMTRRWLSDSDGSVIFFRSLSRTDWTRRLRHLVW